MVVALHQLTAALYLLAGIVAVLGVALPAPRLFRASAGVLVVGALVHGVAFSILHRADPPIPLTDMPAAVSFMGWVGVLFSLFYLRRTRFAALEVGVAPLAFLAVFVAAAQIGTPGSATTAGSGSWPHAHVLLSSAALSLLCVAGLRVASTSSSTGASRAGTRWSHRRCPPSNPSTG